MNEIIEYKGYNGSINISEEDNCLWGRVLGIQSLLLYEGDTAEKLEKNFKKVVDEYLETCASSGATPEIPFQDGILTGAVTVLRKALEKKAQAQGADVKKYIL